MKPYSDLIIEANSPLSFTSITNSKLGIDIAEHDIDQDTAKRINRKQGKYVSLFLDYDTDNASIQKLLFEYLKKLFSYLKCSTEKMLVVGLGNAKYIVDSLGQLSIEKLKTKPNKLMTLLPNIDANTGIESSSVIKAICKEISPSVCIVIDSIATLSSKRLALCYQLTSAGIMPGGGIDKTKKVYIDNSYLDCPIIAIGFPLILSTNYGHMTPYNIEDVIKKASDNISKAINNFF